jgi:hypothetical protein
LSEPSPYSIHEPTVGRPRSIELPLPQSRSAAPWQGVSVCIERMSVISSTIFAVWGRHSESSIPAAPCLRNSNGVPRIAPGRFMIASTFDGPVYFCPLSRLSTGLGSKRSIWLGPPFWKRQITRSARAGIRHGAAVPPAAEATARSARSRSAAASIPVMPMAERPRNTRRLSRSTWVVSMIVSLWGESWGGVIRCREMHC